LDLLVVHRRVGDSLTIGIRKLETGMNVIRFGRGGMSRYVSPSNGA
jgi:hypothetical protein